MDYYYYKSWPDEREGKPSGFQLRASVFKSHGTLAHPGVLVEGDDNLVLTPGGAYSQDFARPGTKRHVTPFVDFDFAWDRDRNNYNTKFIPGLGVTLRYPPETGEIFAGARPSADHRWISATTDIGPGLFFGWYRGF